MSYNVIIVRSPVPDQDQQAWKHIRAVLACQDDEDDLPPHPDFLALIDRLTARFPCICDLPPDQADDGIWSDGPLRDNAGHSATVLGLTRSGIGEGLPFLVATANDMGMVVFDEQQGAIFRPPPATTPSKSLCIDLFRVVITGARAGQRIDAVAERLAPLFRRPVAEALQVLTMGRAVVKSQVDQETAEKYARALRDRGCACELEDDGMRVAMMNPNSIQYLKAAAAGGKAEEQFRLGMRYYHGQEVERDLASALSWWRKAAEQGHSYAQFHVALSHADDEFDTEDLEQELAWLHKAAAQGQANAQFRLGVHARDYLYIPKKAQEALRWMRLAAAQGHREAQFMVGVMADEGEGMARNRAMADRWYRRAALQGHKAARGMLGQLN